MPTAAIRKALAQAHRASGYPETRVNMILSPGDHAGGVFGATDPRLVMLVRECVPYPDKAYREGHRLAIFDGERPLPELKTTNYMVGYEAMRQPRPSAQKRRSTATPKAILPRALPQIFICSRMGSSPAPMKAALGHNPRRLATHC